MHRVFAVLMISLGSTACAFTNIPLTLPSKGLGKHDSQGGNGRQIVIIVPFSDGREIRDRCGMPEERLQHGYR